MIDDFFANTIIVPNAGLVLRCFWQGADYYHKDHRSVGGLNEFINLLKSCTKAKKNIVISNFQTKINSMQRYSADDEVPF